MAESGCLKSEKLHTLTLKDDLVTKHFETREHMSLTGGTESFGELNPEEASLINGTFKDLNKDNDEGQKTNTIGGFKENDTVFLPELTPVLFSDPNESPAQSLLNAHHATISGAGSSIIGKPIPVLHGSDSEIKALIETNPTPPNEDSHSNVHKITMPPQSILKNMYVIVQNNNVSISQNVGTSADPEDSSANVEWYADPPPAPPVYKDTSLRLTTVKKDTNNNYVKIFENPLGGDIDNFITGNEIGDGNVVLNTDNSGDGLDNFRHAGAILPKNTIIPIVTNYLFSTRQEKQTSICINGYIHPLSSLDRFKLSNEGDNLLEGGFSNLTNEEKEIFVIIDSSLDSSNRKEGLTGITHGRWTNDRLSIESNEVAIKQNVFGTSPYLSNRVRDSTFINPEIRIREHHPNGDDRTIFQEDGDNPSELYTSLVNDYDIDYKATQYKDDVIFKVICDFQIIDETI